MDGDIIILQLLCYQIFCQTRVSGYFLKGFHMNNQDRPQFFPFHLTQWIQINIHVDRKVFYLQGIVFMFGHPERLRYILASPLPIIIPMIQYKHSFDVHVFILF